MLSIQNFSEMFRWRRQKRSKHSSTPHIWFSNWNMISKCWMSSRVDLKMDLLCSLCSHTYEILQTWRRPLALGLIDSCGPEFMLCSFSSSKKWQKVQRVWVRCPKFAQNMVSNPKEPHPSVSWLLYCQLFFKLEYWGGFGWWSWLWML